MPTTRVPCSNSAKTRNPLKCSGVPKLANRSQLLVGRSSPYCEDMWRRYRCLTGFFSVVDACLSCEDIARQSCAMVPRWRIFGDFLRPAFPASRVQHVSDLHPKICTKATPCVEVWQTCNLRRLRLGKEKKKKTRMWANAQPDGRPAEHRWRPLFNAAKFG